MTWLDEIHVGDCRDLMRQMIDAGVRVNSIVTSPPYFGLRDYGHPGQIGLEAQPTEYVETMRVVFEIARALLADDGTLWLNLGDSYAGSGRGGHVGNGSSTLEGSTEHEQESRKARGSQLAPGLHAAAAAAGSIGRAWVPPPVGMKQKNLLGIPWRVAFALQEAGWYLRQDIIWAKPNPMPESVRDRCTKAHEYLFLLAKAERYHFDADAIAEPLGASSIARLAQDVESQNGSERVPGKTNGAMKAVGRRRDPGNKTHKGTEAFGAGDGAHRTKAGLVSFAERERAKVEAGELVGTRNKRSVWSIATEGFGGAHFATFPRELVAQCILAGSRPGDVVFDPFMGSGTVAEVALSLGRRFIGCELNPEYAAMFASHRSSQRGLAI